MKLLIIVAVVLPAFVSVRATEKMGNLTKGLSRVFEIETKDVEMCMHRIGASVDDFRLFVTVMSEPEGLHSENTVEEELGQEKLRRVTCVLSCCAQKQGSMIGSKIQLPVLYNMIKKSEVPREVESLFTMAVNECNEEVKEITDECDVVHRFLSCLAVKLQYFSYR